MPPSLREGVARLLDLTPATVSRAYRSLQAEGSIEAMAGSGPTVANVREIKHEASSHSLKLLEQTIDDAAASLLRMNFGVEDIKVNLRRRWE